MPRQHGKRRLRRPSKPCYNEAAPAASRTQLNLPITARSPSRYIIYQEVVEFVVCHLLRQVDVPSRQRIPSTGARDHITWMITPWAPSTGARDHITWLITPWFPQPLPHLFWDPLSLPRVGVLGPFCHLCMRRRCFRSVRVARCCLRWRRRCFRLGPPLAVADHSRRGVALRRSLLVLWPARRAGNR